MPSYSLEKYRALIEALSNAIAGEIAAFYEHPDIPDNGNDRVHCVLNALAGNVGAVLAGTGAAPAAIKFFTDAVAAQVAGAIQGDDENGKTTKH